MNKRFVVKTYTICDGWTNCWTEEDDKGSRPTTFASYDEAQAAIDEFIAEVDAEIKAGERLADSGYDHEDFIIVEEDEMSEAAELLKTMSNEQAEVFVKHLERAVLYDLRSETDWAMAEENDTVRGCQYDHLVAVAAPLGLIDSWVEPRGEGWVHVQRHEDGTISEADGYKTRSEALRDNENV